MHNYIMKSLNDYKEEIYKCSKCGLCQSVCPVYETTKNESSVSRGKFILLNGIIQNELKLNNSIINNLNSCLNCNACRDFCPSDINSREIFACAKNEYNKQKNAIKFINSVKLHEFKLKSISILIFVYKFLRLDKLTNGLLKKTESKSKVSNFILLFNYLIEEKSKYRKLKKTNPPKGKILFFESCYSKYINPGSKNASLNLLEELGYEVIKKKTNCCGVHSYYSGYFDDFEKNAESNFKKIPEDIDYITSDCDSCSSALKLYDDFLNSEHKISFKITSLSKLLKENEFEIASSKKTNIIYHKPCNSDDNHLSLLKSLKNIGCLIENTNCCGFSSALSLKYNEIAEEISKKSAKEIIKNNPDIVITSCHSCKIGIKAGLLAKASNVDVLSLSEFLDSRNDSIK